MATIERIHAREVLDSRGDPTVEVEVTIRGGAVGRAIVPSGASTGRHEAVELRDGDAARYDGRGVLAAVRHVREVLAPALVGQDASAQRVIDDRLIELDGTADKSRLGANAILGVSLASAHAAAQHRGVPLFEHLAALFADAVSRVAPAGPGTGPSGGATALARPTLPLPMVNMISGGLHAGGNLDFQDFLIVPLTAESYSTALAWTVRIYRRLAALLAARGLESVLVAHEGGFGPRLDSNQAAAELLLDAIRRAGFEPGRDVALAIDVASTHFASGAAYRLAATGGDELSATQLVDLLAQWADAYPIVSIEDGCAEDDWDGWKLLSDRLGKRVQLIGDDLFATRGERLARGIATGTANAVLVKLNQAGTLSETLGVIAQAQRAGYRAVVSARSGETEDASIAHLAVATSAGQIKIGSVARSERLAKYNELLRIEERLGPDAAFAGRRAIERS